MNCRICNKNSGYYHYCSKDCQKIAESKNELYAPLDQRMLASGKQTLDGRITVLQKREDQE